MRWLPLLLLVQCRAPDPPAPVAPLAVPIGSAPRANDDVPLLKADTLQVPGRILLAAASVDGGLVAPPDWIEERPDLTGIWPALPAIALQETWVARVDTKVARLETVCRTATWDAPLETVARGGSPRVDALLARVSSDGDNRAADWADRSARVRFVETRQRMGHLGSGGASTPLSELFICVDGVESASVKDAGHAFIRAVPSAAPALPFLELPGVHVLIAELKRRRGAADETSIQFLLDDDAQLRVAEWIVGNGLATRHASIPWAFDSTDGKRSFIFYPPRGQNLVQLEGR